MIGLLARLFIKRSDDAADPGVRLAYGTLCGALGIALNLLLAAAAAGEPEADAAAALNMLLAEKDESELGKILLDPPAFSDPEKALNDSVKELLRISRRSRYTRIANEMRLCSDPERRLELMKQLQEVLKDR